LKEPITNAEWQEAVDLAKGFLHLDAAVKYGLVTWSGGVIYVHRCEDILRQGKERGVTPTPGCVERFVAKLAGL
jgi:hypothetical protein